MQAGTHNRTLRPAALALLALLLALAARVAAADGGPHGSYGMPATDACAACHRTHTAGAPGLLVSANTALCLTCHGPDATGAETNVVDGVYGGTTLGSPGAGLNGGGFSFAQQDTSLAGSPVSGTVTANHTVDGMAGYLQGTTMWGGAGEGAGDAFDLYCTSCHDPHGSNNYRVLKEIVNGVPVTVTQTDEASKSYTAATYYKAGGTWEISSFCAACHTRYQATDEMSGGTPSGDGIFSYRHRNDVQSGAVARGITYDFPAALDLPVSSTGGAPVSSPEDNRVMVCLTCHYAHGTKATMGNNSGAVAWPGGAAGPAGDARSSLLRLDNRGVCQNCHAI